jgi:hypothetical protein
MSDFEQQLNSILSSPETMEQIVSLARSLSSGGGETAPAPEQEAEPQTDASEPQSSAPASSVDLSGLLTMLSGSHAPLGDVDPALVQDGLKLIQAYHEGSDQQIALLTALRPFLQEERQAKLDRAIQLTRVARVLQTAYQMFRTRKEGEPDHV